MSRRLDWSRTKWENRYFEIVGEAPERFGPWKPPVGRRKPLPLGEKPARIRAGDLVYARRWGTGKVMEVGRDGVVTILFQQRFKREVRYEELRPKP